MSCPVFYVVPASTLPIPFDSFDGGTGASITITGLAITDVEIYKAPSMTQRASDNGVVLTDTDGIDLDGITGIQGFSINFGDNSDAGFYAEEAWYRVVVSAVTIDGQTVNFTAAMVYIMSTTRGMAGTALPGFAADAAGGLPVSDAGELDMDGMNAAAVRLTAARAGALTDWIDGGRLDLLLDAIQTDLDNGTDGLGALKTLIDALNDPTVGAIADAVLEEAVADHLSAGTVGKHLSDTFVDTADIQPKIGAPSVSLAADIAAIPTTAMRGTDDAALAIVVGALADAAATGAPTSADTIMAYIKQRVNSASLRNVAQPDIPVLMVLASDHVTPATGLTVTATRSLDGAAWTAVGGAIAEIGNGLYQFDATAADKNGVICSYRFVAATADDRFLTIVTSP